MYQFEVGGTYWTRFPADSICRFRVVRRSDKSVWITEDCLHPDLVEARRKIYPGPYAEVFAPYGEYATCPIVSADRKCAGA